jgi:hypothetical protein
MMRRARSYSIIDHEILHSGYLGRLSHESMVLYLFLVVVGNRDGRSFYADRTIMSILRLSPGELDRAREQLIKEGLIDYHRPDWWVKSISCVREAQHTQKGEKNNGGVKTKDTLPSGWNETELSSDRRASRDFAKARIKDIQRMLRGR